MNGDFSVKQAAAKATKTALFSFGAAVTVCSLETVQQQIPLLTQLAGSYAPLVIMVGVPAFAGLLDGARNWRKQMQAKLENEVAKKD